MATETKSKVPNQEQIINGFNQLRNQQRQIVMKISEITDERKEHQMVYETLKDTEKDRACFRMVGGVLVKLTVGEVVPSLQNTIEQMGKLLEMFDKQLEEKGKELLEYREKHDLKIQGEGTNPGPSQPSTDVAAKGDSSKSTGVLVTS